MRRISIIIDQLIYFQFLYIHKRLIQKRNIFYSFVKILLKALEKEYAKYVELCNEYV